MTTTSLQIHLEPDHLLLTLGERATIEVEVFNSSSIVDEFRVDLLGPEVDPIRPEWVTAQPSTIALFPNQSGVVTLTLDVPAASQLLAGRHVLGVRVRSTTDPRHALVQEMPLVINSQPIVSLHLEPEMVKGGRTALVEAVLRNMGNVPTTVRFSATDPAGAMTFTFADREVDLPTDEELRIPLHLRARRPILGTGASRPYAITADVEDRADTVGAEAQPYVEPARTDGSFQQSPWVNGRVLTILGTILPVIAILIAAWILRPQTEPVDLSGELTFGVHGVVESVEARAGETALAGRILARLDRTEALVAMNGAQLSLRRAIVDYEGLKTQHLIESAQAVLGDDTPPVPDAGFLEQLVAQLRDAVQSALLVSSTALNGLSESFLAYCTTLDTPLPECSSAPIPLPPGLVAQIAADVSNPAARAVLDANANYQSASTTLRAIQALADQASEQLLAAGGDPEAVPADNAEARAALEAALAQQALQAQEERELQLLEAQAVIAEAQLACRAAVQNVGRTVLRSPVDSIVIAAEVTAGTEVDATAPAFVLERTDGRPFRAPAGARAPASQDLPPDGACPATITELQSVDAGTSNGAGASRDNDK